MKNTQVIREVWESVLGVRRVRLNVPFAEYGGDSLSAVSVVSQAARRGVKLVFTPDFDMKSITELALYSVAPGSEKRQGGGGGKAIKEWDTRETYQKGGMKWFVGGISACAEGRLGDAISLWDQGRGWDPRYSADKYGSTPLVSQRSFRLHTHPLENVCLNMHTSLQCWFDRASLVLM